MNWAFLLCLAEFCNFACSAVPALAPPSRGATGIVNAPSQAICRRKTCGPSKICVVNSRGRELCVCAPCANTASRKPAVCGNDGQTYSSKCALKYQRCTSRNKTLKLAHKGECRVSTSTTEPPVVQGVCSANDVQSFLSYFRNRLLDDMELMRDGKISDTTFELLPRTQQNSLIESQFTAADQDPIDGYLTSEETRRFYPLAAGKKACLDSLLSSCDINNNGQHSRAEWKYCLELKEHDN